MSASADLHQAVSDAVYLRSPDAAGVVALLLRQGPRVDAEDEKAYVELTGLNAQLAQVLEDAQSPAAARLAPLLSGKATSASSRKQLEAAMAHAIFLRVAEPVELMAHLASAAVDAGEARMEELLGASPEEYVQKTELDTKLAAAMDASGLRSDSPPPDVLQKLANALAPRKPETKKSNGSGAPSNGSGAAAAAAANGASLKADADAAQLQQLQAQLAEEKLLRKQAEEKLTAREAEQQKTKSSSSAPAPAPAPKTETPKQKENGGGGAGAAPPVGAAASVGDGAMSALIDGLVQQVLASAKEVRDFKELAWATHVVGVGSGAKILDVRDSTGHTALLHATKKPPHAAAIRRLLEAGADKTIKDPDGRTAAMLATTSGDAEVEKVFDAFMDAALDAPPPAEGEGGEKKEGGDKEGGATGADKEADSGKGTGALIVDSGTGEMKLMAVVSLGKSGVQLHELGSAVKMEKIEAADKKIKKNTTAEVAVAGSGWSQEAKDPSTMTAGFRTITKTFGGGIDELQAFDWFEQVEWTDAFIGATEWYRKLIDDSEKDGSERGAKATAFLDDLAAWLTDKLNRESIMQRVRVERISAENEAQYEYRAVEYAVKRSGLSKQIAMMGMGSGSVQLVGFDTKISFSAVARDGEAMLAKAGGDAAQRARALEQWRKTVRDSFNESSNSLTSLIMEAAQQRERASKVRLVMISGAYYVAAAAKIATKPPAPYGYQSALECNAKLARLRDAPPTADDADANKNAANAARLLAVLDGLFEGHADNVEYLFARDWVLDGIKFRTTWAAGWFLESMVRSKFKDGDGKQDGGEKRRAVAPFGALAIDVLPKRLTMSCVLLRADASLEVHEVASTKVEPDMMARCMRVAQTEAWAMVHAQLLQPVADGLEKAAALAEAKGVPLISFQPGVFRKAEFLSWLERRASLSASEIAEMKLDATLVKEDLAMAGEFLLKLRKKVNGMVGGLKRGRQVMPRRPPASDHFLAADAADFSLEDAARLEEAAVHFALLKNGSSKCDAVLSATGDDLVFLTSAACAAAESGGGVAAIETNVDHGVNLCKRGGSNHDVSGAQWKAALAKAFAESGGGAALAMQAELLKLPSRTNRPVRVVVSGKPFHAVAVAAKVVEKDQPKPQYAALTGVAKKLDDAAVRAAVQKRFGPSSASGSGSAPNQATATWLDTMLRVAVGGDAANLDKVRCLVAREWTVDGEVFVPTWVAGWALGLKPSGSARTVHDHTLNLVGDEPETLKPTPPSTAMVPAGDGKARRPKRTAKKSSNDIGDMGEGDGGGKYNVVVMGPWTQDVMDAMADAIEFDDDDDDDGGDGGEEAEQERQGMSEAERKKLEQATSESLDFRMGSSPEQVKMFGPRINPTTKEQEKDDKEQLVWDPVKPDELAKLVKQGAGSSYYHLHVPAGHFLEVNQHMRSRYGYGDQDYYTIAIDIRYTYTGEGGGFPLMTGMTGSQRERYAFPSYVRNFDGKLSNNRPPATPDNIKPDPKRNKLHQVEEMKKEAEAALAEGSGNGKLTPEQEKRVAELQEEAHKAHLEDARVGSQEWHRIHLAFTLQDGQRSTGYRDGQQESIEVYHGAYVVDGGFSLFYSSDPKYRLQEGVDVRLVTLYGNKGQKSCMAADEAKLDFDKRNTDLNEAMLQTLLREKELRENLYLPTMLAEQNTPAANKRSRRLLALDKSAPAIWTHEICCRAFSIEERAHDAAKATFIIGVKEYLKDFVTFIDRMLGVPDQTTGERMLGELPSFMRSEELFDIGDSCKDICQMFAKNHKALQRNFKAEAEGDKDDKGKASSGAGGGQKQEDVSLWERKQRLVGEQLNRVKALHEADPTDVHFNPFFAIPNVVHVVIMTESAAQLAYNLRRPQVERVRRVVDTLNKIEDERINADKKKDEQSAADAAGVGGVGKSPSPSVRADEVGAAAEGAAEADGKRDKKGDEFQWIKAEKFLKMQNDEGGGGSDEEPMTLADLEALRKPLEDAYKKEKEPKQILEFQGGGSTGKPLEVRKHVDAKVRSYRCVTINLSAERDYHAKLPTGQDILYNAYLELKGVPKERMESEMWWNMCMVLLDRSGEVFTLYKQLLPWLVQKPLTEVHQANQEDALLVHPEFACWANNAAPNFSYTHMGLIQYILLVWGHTRQDVDWFFFCFRYFLLTKTSSDLAVLKKHEGMVTGTMMRSVQAVVAQISLEAADSAQAAMAAPGTHLPAQKWRQWHCTLTEEGARLAKRRMTPQVLHVVLKATMDLRDMLNDVEQLQRPAPPKLLTLSTGTKQATCQHVFWDAARLAGVDTTSNETMGESTLDKDMSGLLGLRVFEKELYQVKKDFTPALCTQVLKQTLEVALQLSNLSDAKWGAHMTAALLSNVFLKVLPMPRPGGGGGNCVWQRRVDKENAVPECTVSYITTTLARLMEVLAQAASNMAAPSRSGQSRPGEGPATDHGGAEAFHPELLLISGTIAAITDAVCRRDQNDQAGMTDAIKATLLTRLLCGAVGELNGEDPEEVRRAGRNTYGISIRSFEARTANVRFLFYHHYLARTAIVDYFRGLKLPTCNYLFEFERPSADQDQQGVYNPKHGVDQFCATWRLFKKLGQGIYSRVTKAIHDPNGDLAAMGPENIAFRDVMVYFKIFVLTADAGKPFHLPNCKERVDYKLQFFEGDYIEKQLPTASAKLVLRSMAYCVFITNKRGGHPMFVHINPELDQMDLATMARQGIEIPPNFRLIRKPRKTASDVQFHTTKVRSGDAEDDILHIRRLPEFEGLQLSSVERLLQYLTVPYLRVPLIIDFFSSQDHISALKDTKLRALVEAAIFEPSTYLPAVDASTKAADEVPSRDADDATTATRYGVLINEIAQSGPRLLASITRLLEVALTFDTYDIDGSMAAVILFLSRIAVDVEMAASMLMAREDNQMVLSLASEDDKFLNPRSAHQMMPDLIELRALLRQTMPSVLEEWFVTMERKAEATEAEEREKGAVVSSQERIARRGRRDLNRTIIHGHLVVLRANLQDREIHAEIIASVLSSFMYAAAKHGNVVARDSEGHKGGRRLLVALPYLFAIMARLRVMFVEWLTFEKRPQSAISFALNAAYRAATDDDTKSYLWTKMNASDPQNKGRFNATSEKGETTELNLQVMQVAAAGGVIKPLPSRLLDYESVKNGLALPLKMQGELHASLEDSRKNCSRYKLVGQDIYLNVWSHDTVLQRLTELNEKEKARQLRAFKSKVKGVAVSDAADAGADDGDDLTKQASLVRDEQGRGIRFNRLVETVMREEDSKLLPHEKWISDLMELVPRALLQKVQITEASSEEEERKRRAGGEGEKDAKKRMLRFYVTEQVPLDARVVKLQGVLQSMTVLELTEEGEEVDRSKGRRRYGEKTVQETVRDRYCAIMYEAYCFKDRNMVQIFQLRSDGRQYYRRMCYCTANHLSLHHFPKIDVEMKEMNEDLREAQGTSWETNAFKAKSRRRRAVVQSQGVSIGLEIDPIHRESVVMRRRAPDLGLPGIDPANRPWERYMTREVLHGLLPDALLEKYDFYRDESGLAADLEGGLVGGDGAAAAADGEGGLVGDGASAATSAAATAAAAAAGKLIIRGYPIKKDVRVSYEDDLKKEPEANVLLVEESSGAHELYELFGTGPDYELAYVSRQALHRGTAGDGTLGLQVVRYYLDETTSGKQHCRLLNLLNAREGDELYTLSDVLLRLENLSHILVWSKLTGSARPANAADKPGPSASDGKPLQGGAPEPAEEYTIDMVELPRMQLSFEAQSREDGTTKKTKTVLRSVELPHLHIFSPDAVATLGDKTTAVRLTGREVWRAHEDVLKVTIPPCHPSS